MTVAKANQARSYARKRAVQLLYQWQLNPTPAGEMLDEFSSSQEMERVDIEYFEKIIRGVISTSDEIDEGLLPFLDISFDKLDPIELTILRLSLYELIHYIELPYKVIINEAINLAKTYGGEQGHAFINAVLDKAIKEHRSLELKANSK